MSLYDELRRKHGSFIYHSYEFMEQDGSTLLRFHFSIDEYHFYPGWTFPEEFSGLTFDRELADRIAFSLGMAELVSYWKCACPPVVEIRCGGLSEEQKLWWKKFWMMPGFFIISRRSGSRAKSCMRCCTVWNCNDLLNDGGIICLIRITR